MKKILSWALAMLMVVSLCAAAVAEGEYEYGTVHGITWTWGGLADQADETAVQREAETNERYFNATGNTRVCEAFTYDYQGTFPIGNVSEIDLKNPICAAYEMPVLL